MAHRTSTLGKAVARIDEIAGRADLIHNALRSTLPDFIAFHPLGEVVDRYKEYVDAVERLDKAVGTLLALSSLAREVMLPERMDNDQSKTFSSDLNRITRTSRIFAGIRAGKQEDAFKWLRDNDFGSLIKETVNSSSLSSAAKELAERGFDMPEDIFNVHYKNGVSITAKR
jgi:hypothetical protein